MTSSSYRSVVITGASEGIGAALACKLARPGLCLFLMARRADRLAEVATACSASGASVVTHALDVTDRSAMADALLNVDAAAPVDLVIVNAGISSGLGPGRSPEPAAAARRVFAVHVDGMLNTLEPLLPGMMARGAGQIALMSSLAASSPLAEMPAYSASKAAIRAYGTSLRRWLKPYGISVSVICPGFVKTSMSARHHGYKPFEVPVDRAAGRILKGLATREAYVAFPWPLAVLVWLGNRLPPHLADRATTRFAAEIESNSDAQG